jgi:CBS domain-containing protein
MKASDIMTTNVVTAGMHATVRDVAQLLFDKHVSAVLVVGSMGELLGIISEGDLLRRTVVGTEKHRSWWLEALIAGDAPANKLVKSNARKVTDVMTRQVVTAGPDTPVSDIATLLEENGITRLPIIDGGKVIGIVSRANLIQALASTAKPSTQEAKVDDSTIHKSILAQFKTRPWATPWSIDLTVHDGIVDLWGIVDSQAEKEAACVAVETTPGVRAIHNHLVRWPVTSSP